MKVQWILLVDLQQLQRLVVLLDLTVDLLVDLQQPQKPKVLLDLTVDHLYSLKKLRSSEAEKHDRPKLPQATVMGFLFQGLPFLPEEPQDHWVEMLA